MIVDFVFDFMSKIFSQVNEINSVILFLVFIFFVVIAYKIFKTLFKALMVGLISAMFPVIAYLLGFNIPVTFQSIIWFSLTGMLLFFLYSIISGGVKIIKILTSPFKLLFRKKEKK